MKTKTLLFGAFALCFSLGLFTACGNSGNNNPTTPEAPETHVKFDMTAPQVKPDESGFIEVGQFPTTHPHLTVKVSDDFTTATIFYDGKEIQTVEDEYGLVVDEPTVCFIDVNFDGQTDIYIRSDMSHTPRALLVWDEFEQQFQVIKDPSLQDPMLHPATKSFIDGGSGFSCEAEITLSKWKGNMILAEESLTIIGDPEYYSDFRVEHRFTLMDADDKVKCSTEEREALPEMWQTIVKYYGY